MKGYLMKKITKKNQDTNLYRNYDHKCEGKYVCRKGWVVKEKRERKNGQEN